MKRINEAEALTKIANNEELKELLVDAIATINQGYQLMKQLESMRVLGNQTLSVEAKIDHIYIKMQADTCFEVARYDCIEQLNTMVGGNMVDMTGTDKQVCMRFWHKYHVIANAG